MPGPRTAAQQSKYDWRESALGGGLLVIFLLTIAAIPFAIVVFRGLMWSMVVGGLLIALLAFIDHNGAGLRGQVLRPGRVAIIGSVLLGIAVRMLMN